MVQDIAKKAKEEAYEAYTEDESSPDFRSAIDIAQKPLLDEIQRLEQENARLKKASRENLKELLDFIKEVMKPAEKSDKSIMPSSEDQKKVKNYTWDAGWLDGTTALESVIVGKINALRKSDEEGKKVRR